MDFFPIIAPFYSANSNYYFSQEALAVPLRGLDFLLDLFQKLLVKFLKTILIMFWWYFFFQVKPNTDVISKDTEKLKNYQLLVMLPSRSTSAWWFHFWK